MAIEQPDARGREPKRSAGSESVRVAVSEASNAVEAVAEIAAKLGASSDIAFLLVFVAARHSADAVAAALADAFPDVRHAGCSTAGEFAPVGPVDAGLVAVAFPKADFTIACAPLRGLSTFGLEDGGGRLADLCRTLEAELGRGEGDTFALTLLDGLCRREEVILAALQQAMPGMPMVGGSNGDDLSFRSTFVIADGEVVRDGGLLLLIRTALPFRPFAHDHFEPTARKLVVTGCDADQRRVTEIDAEPAWDAFAAATLVDASGDDTDVFAAHPLLVRIGGEYYCRSIQRRNDDRSLSFYCAIGTGVVLTVAETREMVGALEQALDEIDRDLGGIDFVLGFDCVHRRIEAAGRQVADRISDVFRRFRVVGFNTYGEQFDAIHLNHTFTGVAFGRRQETP